MNRVDRIKEMEQCLDVSAAAVRRMTDALEEYEAAQKAYKKLSDYYGSARWMKDFEDDEAGRLPLDLKRGVLSEDAVYHALKVRMMKLLARAMDKHLI